MGVPQYILMLNGTVMDFIDNFKELPYFCHNIIHTSDKAVGSESNHCKRYSLTGEFHRLLTTFTTPALDMGEFVRQKYHKLMV